MGGKFVKGQSGNPKGRPRKGHSFAEIARARLARAHDEDNSNYEAIIDTAIRKAIEEGDKGSRDFLAERVDGKVADRVITTEVELDEIILMN